MFNISLIHAIFIVLNLILDTSICLQFIYSYLSNSWLSVKKIHIKFVNMNNIIQIQKEESKMSQYLTPLKEANQIGKGQSKMLTQPRQGDWVCLNCNNLNFSFRKKCNRCRVQTRQMNQEASAYYYSYYPEQFYYAQEKENFNTVASYAQLPKQKEQIIEAINLSIEKGKQQDENTPKKIKVKEQLPSVSPLVKRYNYHENNSTQSSKRQGLFQNEGMWANINMNYLDQPQKVQFQQISEQSQEESDEIERIIQQIIL